VLVRPITQVGEPRPQAAARPPIIFCNDGLQITIGPLMFWVLSMMLGDSSKKVTINIDYIKIKICNFDINVLCYHYNKHFMNARVSYSKFSNLCLTIFEKSNIKFLNSHSTKFASFQTHISRKFATLNNATFPEF